MKGIFNFIGTGLILFSSVEILATDLPDFAFLVSTGEASRDVKPDMATLSISLLAFNEAPEIAVEELAAAFGKSLEVLSKYEVPIESIEATDLRRSLTRARNSDHQNLQILGYQFSRTILVELDSLASYSDMTEELAAVPNLSNLDARFDVSNRKQIEGQLLTEASANAIQKAELMADSFGQQVDSVYAISQASNFGGFFATFGAQSHGAYSELASPLSDRRTMSMFMPESISIRQMINAVLRIDER